MSSTSDDVVELNWMNKSFCTIRLQGGTISSWRIYNHEMLFVSKLSLFSRLATVTGGIQLVFPHFTGIGDFDADFANIMKWDLLECPRVLSNGDVECTISLSANAYSFCRWRRPFKIIMVIRLQERDLIVLTQVFNPNERPLKFNIATRCYLNVPIKYTYMHGFQRAKFMNLRTNKHGVFGYHPFMPSANLDIIFRKMKSPSIEIAHYYRSHIIRVRSLNYPEIRLWNENAEVKPHGLHVDDTEQQQWLCVQPTSTDLFQLEHGCSVTVALYLSKILLPKRI